jgi:ABC-type lipoprotein release transport system permease subunit
VTASLIDGRLPQGLDEIALGTETLDKIGAGVGDEVSVEGQRGRRFHMRVVGRVAIPNFPFSFNRPGEGGAVSLQAANRIAPQGPGKGIFARFTPGADQEAVLTRLRHLVPRLFVLRQQRTTELTNLNQVGQAPLVLAGIVALMAAATLAHTLITSIRRRRLDFAILKTLGFLRSQVSATVAWQATTLAFVALLVGIPLGIVGGRWGWNVFADRLGVVPDAVVPLVAIALAVPVTIVVANLLAAVPGRIASRLKAAPVLRSE